jgi:nanoRNase/pAp phosphatase (c-di-AMP/oligoRNAs hydrolase)
VSDHIKYRLVTRSDFDGLVCALLLKEIDLIDDILFVHPKDMQDRKVEISDRDITTNLPYVETCYLAFDHHESEAIRRGQISQDNHILDPAADSAARVVYEYYGGKDRFPNVADELMEAVDKADSARFTIDEVLNPSGWVLLSFLMDARTGLGRFRNFRISNYQLMMHLIDYCRKHTVEEILELPDVKERVDLYFEHAELAQAQIRRCSTVHGNLVVLDLRGEEVILPCNRFMIYALYPTCNISIHVMWGKGMQNTVFAIGNSIFNRTSATNIGELALRNNGGGHANAGTCQFDNARADEALAQIIAEINEADEVPMIEISAVTDTEAGCSLVD